MRNALFIPRTPKHFASKLMTEFAMLWVARLLREHLKFVVRMWRDDVQVAVRVLREHVHQAWGIRTVIHGDDFLSEGSGESPEMTDK